MQAVSFAKMSGVGKDLIVGDKREGILNELGVREFARRVCARRMSLGGGTWFVAEGALHPEAWS